MRHLPSTHLLALAITLAACQVQTPAHPSPPGASPPGGEPILAAQAAPLEAAPAQPQGALGLQVTPQFRQVAPGARTLNVLIRLEGLGRAPAQRPPLDLAIVIDRSGSMSGEKLVAVKQAALKLLDKLGPTDRVTLISYSSDVRRHATRRPVNVVGKEALRAALLGLSADGNTALGPAMLSALGVLESAPPGAGGALGRGEIRHLLLLSDGLANTGEQRPAVLGARAAQAFGRGVSVSTLGVGLDYNEDLMTRLADQGGGRYHFVERGEAVAAVLDDELSGLAATVARGVVLDIQPAPGVAVEKVFGYPTQRQAGGTQVRIGALAAGRSRHIIARLTLPAGGRASLGLGSFEARYTDVRRDGVPGRVRLDAKVPVAADAAIAQASEDSDVTVRVAQVENAERLHVAAAATGSGDFGRAQSVLQVAIDDLQTKQQAREAPSPKLTRQIRDLKDAREQVERAKTSTRARKRFSKAGKAAAYSTLK